MAYTYGSNDSWTQVSSNTQNPNGYAPVSGSSNSSSGSSPSSDSTQVNSSDTAKKAQAVLEYNTLTGELVLRLCTNSLKVKVNKTITLSGVGKYLSGQYYVEGVKYTLSANNQFEIACTLIKTGFGDNLKAASPSASDGMRSTPLQVQAT